MRRKSASLTAFLMCIGIAWFLPHSVLARVQNQFCGNCHSMHNSQDGETVIDEAQRHLLGQDCIGCHTGRNEGTSATPYVYDLDGPTYGSNTLAGGNFYWVATAGGGNDTKGHNVLDLSGQDTNIEASEGAPGGSVSCANSCHNTLAVAQSAAGYEDLGSGCEGCHLDVKHHADDSTDTVVGEDNGWYRFLAGHDSGAGNGVEGIEDDDWEYTSSAADHNEYLGLVGDHTAHAGFLNLGNTMTGYCCGCHGNFHIQDDSGLWIRHPSDVVLPIGGEYAAYTTYSPEAPVARPDLSSYTGSSATVTPGTDLVMCLSCHRAHGSPYPDMLRWDYDRQIAGGGGDDGTGCFTCHSAKDDS